MKQEKDYMKELADKRVKELLEVNPETVDQDTFQNMLNQAKVGMFYIRDREMMKRIEQGQIIRVVGFVTDDVVERKKYIEITMPKLIPQIH